MKKSVSLLLISILVFALFCFTGCGAINKSDVAVLWSGDGVVKVPNSLINSMERAMYIENIAYKHYGANADVEKQLSQAKEAVEGGCAALAVELVSPLIAQGIVDVAKAKDVPVIFFNCVVDESVIKSYNKCVLITSNTDTISEVQGEVIADYVKANYDNLDKNEDGKISYTYAGFGDIPVKSVEAANKLLATDDYKVKLNKKKINTVIELDINTYFTVDDIIKNVEMIVTEDDVTAYMVLVSLQEKEYNTDKLVTHFIPIFTVGDSVDYKDLVLSDRPEIPEHLVIKDDDSNKEIKNKNKEIKKLENLQAHYYNFRYLLDLRDVNESDLDEMVYTTANVIDSGRLAGTVLVDNDALAGAVAKVLKNFIKGNDTFKKVANDGIIVEGSVVKVRYTGYSN